MEERYSYSNSLWRSMRNGDFEEEDVWGIVKETKHSALKSKSKSKEVGVSVPRPLPSAARMIPFPRTGPSSNSNNNNNYMNHEIKVVQQSSAPVNIPDWSKVYCKKPKKASDHHEEDSEENEYEDHQDYGYGYNDDEEEDDEDDYKMPPHEFIARRMERSQISSFSVFEGIGRTLKGRDLSKVRNAVLTRTGFLESL